ncbi:SDR family oxidoreductase [Streptomyces sp. NBC_01549]|uniref:SDR family oxidoreductase n=1 Tax=Streptomyces sp. NBC_01549 TaxID=2975874 RepID=UPI002B1CDD51|nr:SDR family oxidoreductase [Streptomyces sp. NBC_01549]
MDLGVSWRGGLINGHARGCSAGLASYRADAQARTVGRCVPRGWRGRGGARIVSRGSSPPTSGRIPIVRQGCWGCPGRSPLVSYGVTVNVVAPGYVATGSQLEFEAAAAAAGPIGRSATPDEIAACVMFLAHESASFVTGSALVADGGHGLPETWPRP